MMRIAGRIVGHMALHAAVAFGLALWWWLTLAILPPLIIDESSFGQRLAWVLGIVLLPLWWFVGLGVQGVWRWGKAGFPSRRQIEAETRRLIARGHRLAKMTNILQSPRYCLRRHGGTRASRASGRGIGCSVGRGSTRSPRR